MSYHAKHDTLTGFVNRREFERRASEALHRARQEGQKHSLCYIDLDQFKVVNDTCGHAVGDRLLRQLTYLLREYVRGSDTLARLGGDEFGLLLENCSLEHAQRIADNMRKVIKGFRFTWEGKTFRLSGSLGLVPITSDSISVAEVMAEADAACYAAKEKGRNRVQVYQPGNLELARRTSEMQWVSRITEALHEDRFELYSQLIMPLSADRKPMHEILLRMRDADGELVPLMSFLPAAERYNLMSEIDRWVISATLTSVALHGLAGPGTTERIFAINLSGISLTSPGMLDYIRAQIDRHRIDPTCLCFEVTETAAVANLDEAAEFIKNLRGDGCLFALDDFGSGLSSFTCLKHLPVDFLKIDGSFVREIVEDSVAYSMVEAINTIGHVMNIRTIAEYVEGPEILRRLRQIGVDYAQGFGIEVPAPLSACCSGALTDGIAKDREIRRGSAGAR
jgi:diguanylate cyclase (GGDEF)-like protein